MFKPKLLPNFILCCGLSLLVIGQSASAFSEEPTALEKHMAYFADKYAELRLESMQEKLMKMGFSQEIAYQIADKVSYFGGLVTKGCPYAAFTAKEGVGKLNHARNTGIYNLDGTINETRWQKLLSYSEVDSGKAIITEKKFYEFLKWCRDNDPRPDVTGGAKRASDEEWQAFFMVATDHWKKLENDYERSMTLATLRKFYENTPVIFDEVVKHHLPVPKPQ